PGGPDALGHSTATSTCFERLSPASGRETAKRPPSLPPTGGHGPPQRPPPPLARGATADERAGVGERPLPRALARRRLHHPRAPPVVVPLQGQDHVEDLRAELVGAAVSERVLASKLQGPPELVLFHALVRPLFALLALHPVGDEAFGPQCGGGLFGLLTRAEV